MYFDFVFGNSVSLDSRLIDHIFEVGKLAQREIKRIRFGSIMITIIRRSDESFRYYPVELVE